MFFLLLFVLLIVFSGGGVFYLYTRIMKFKSIENLGVYGKILAFALPALITAIIVFALGMSFFNSIIILLHLVVFWSLCDFVAVILRKIIKREAKVYLAGIFAIVITVAYLGAGWYSAHNVVATEYNFTTEKNIGEDIRIVMIADAHIGVTLDGVDFAREMSRISDEEPDVVVVVGDFVDDETEREDMITACKALGMLKTKYGVYFSFGNHDEGYFRGRGFSANELINELESNGVTVLEDEAVLVGDSVCLVGRLDRSSHGRKDMNAIVSELDMTKYIVVLDHQPNDYSAEAEAKVDLVLSGHTHGGHIFPAGPIGVLIGSNDRYYGTEKRDKTDFVVTSGISGWALPFKTFARSEYVVIDIKNT